MGESALARVEKANPEPDQLVGDSRPSGRKSTDHTVGRIRPIGRSISAAMAAAKRLWPQKAAAELSFRTGVEKRSAERWLAGEREMGLEAFVALLRSDDGFAFLDAVLTAVPAPARPAWWRKLVASQKRADIRRRQKQLAAEIDALEREEQLDLSLRFKGPEGGR